jgi:putative SOS response-associated peptidase YedK
MCGRYTLHTEKEALAERFGFDPADLALLAPRYNIAPTQDVVSVRVRDGKRQAELVRWGLVPWFAKGVDAQPLMINARVETLADKPAFRDALRRRRCLIPADGFYEWRASGKTKLPHWIGLRSGQPFAFAGLWSYWKPKPPQAGEPVVSCAIVTTDANAAVRDLHDRMPVILPRDAEGYWLDPALDDVDALLALLTPVDAAELDVHPVSPRLNSVANDDASLLEPPQGDDPQLKLL